MNINIYIYIGCVFLFYYDTRNKKIFMGIYIYIYICRPRAIFIDILGIDNMSGSNRKSEKNITIALLICLRIEKYSPGIPLCCSTHISNRPASSRDETPWEVEFLPEEMSFPGAAVRP